MCKVCFYSLKKMNALFRRKQKISGKKLANFSFVKNFLWLEKPVGVVNALFFSSRDVFVYPCFLTSTLSLVHVVSHMLWKCCVMFLNS